MMYRVFNDMHCQDFPSIELCHEHIRFFDEQVEWRTELSGPHGNYVHHFGDNKKERPFIRREWLIVELPDDHDLCKTCGGVGYVLHLIDRAGPAPGNMFLGCDDCPEGRKNTAEYLTALYGEKVAERAMRDRFGDPAKEAGSSDPRV
jgi:hypothetical protein